MDNPRLLFFFVIAATLSIIRTGQTTLPAAFLLNSPISSKPIYESSHLLRPPRLFIFINSANTASGKIKIQRIIICYLQASNVCFLLTSSSYIINIHSDLYVKNASSYHRISACKRRLTHSEPPWLKYIILLIQ